MRTINADVSVLVVVALLVTSSLACVDLSHGGGSTAINDCVTVILEAGDDITISSTAINGDLTVVLGSAHERAGDKDGNDNGDRRRGGSSIRVSFPNLVTINGAIRVSGTDADAKATFSRLKTANGEIVISSAGTVCFPALANVNAPLHIDGSLSCRTTPRTLTTTDTTTPNAVSPEATPASASVESTAEASSADTTATTHSATPSAETGETSPGAASVTAEAVTTLDATTPAPAVVIFFLSLDYESIDAEALAAAVEDMFYQQVPLAAGAVLNVAFAAGSVQVTATLRSDADAALFHTALASGQLSVAGALVALQRQGQPDTVDTGADGSSGDTGSSGSGDSSGSNAVGAAVGATIATLAVVVLVVALVLRRRSQHPACDSEKVAEPDGNLYEQAGLASSCSSTFQGYEEARPSLDGGEHYAMADPPSSESGDDCLYADVGPGSSIAPPPYLAAGTQGFYDNSPEGEVVYDDASREVYTMASGYDTAAASRDLYDVAHGNDTHEAIYDVAGQQPTAADLSDGATHNENEASTACIYSMASPSATDRYGTLSSCGSSAEYDVTGIQLPVDDDMFGATAESDASSVCVYSMGTPSERYATLSSCGSNGGYDVVGLRPSLADMLDVSGAGGENEVYSMDTRSEKYATLTNHGGHADEEFDGDDAAEC